MSPAIKADSIHKGYDLFMSSDRFYTCRGTSAPTCQPFLRRQESFIPQGHLRVKETFVVLDSLVI